jgi:hypothetical protein
MILLRRDCLVFETSEGSIPMTAERVTMDVLGDAIQLLDQEILRHVSESVLHYFKEELGKSSVTIAEFTQTLERALGALGLTVQSVKVKSDSSPPLPPQPRVAESDLAHLISESQPAMELLLFPNLRLTVQKLLDGSPDVIRFRGLRPCVKQMLKARRWSQGCQRLNDQIVDYLRGCFDSERRSASCALLVS